ncbi:unnamed protein product [Didymodactylos carnosus]|uniref:RIB43A-like with coiled-coils protein 2 n=1 Tax=Didymodactylos carnosus TaxID=1234261 RepID=A0A8S2TU41_9BILA|nr:unnamed protein product [Didymodactylos carnosus]CAF4307384.1 unnamed protein product [Didymodactylos carnosus]
MYKLDLPIDLKEQAAIERRRRMEKDRQARIFNSKQRQTGIDKDALEQQVQDRQWIEDLEHKRDQAFGIYLEYTEGMLASIKSDFFLLAKDIVRNDTIAQLLQRRQEYDQREYNRSLNEFRAMHQQPFSQREWDLNDPDYLKKDIPARVSDDDPRCGMSGLQKFDGEDLNSKARNKYQQEQLREWSRMQQEHRRQAIDQQNAADRLYEMKQHEMDQRAIELQRAEEECRKAINNAVKNFNSALLRETEERKYLKKRQEDYDNYAEMANMITSDLLTENADQAISQFGPHRVVPDRWKGMSPEQLQKIREEQQRQVEEKKRQEEEERQREEEWNRRRFAEAKAGMISEKQIEREKRTIEQDLYGDNQRLANEQKNLKQYLDRVVYTNQPTAAYFTQFNTNSR